MTKEYLNEYMGSHKTLNSKIKNLNNEINTHYKEINNIKSGKLDLEKEINKEYPIEAVLSKFKEYLIQSGFEEKTKLKWKFDVFRNFSLYTKKNPLYVHKDGEVVHITKHNIVYTHFDSVKNEAKLVRVLSEETYDSINVFEKLLIGMLPIVGGVTHLVMKDNFLSIILVSGGIFSMFSGMLLWNPLQIKFNKKGYKLLDKGEGSLPNITNSIIQKHSHSPTHP